MRLWMGEVTSTLGIEDSPRKEKVLETVTTFFRSGQNSQARPSNWTEPIVLMVEQTLVGPHELL